MNIIIDLSDLLPIMTGMDLNSKKIIISGSEIKFDYYGDRVMRLINMLTERINSIDKELTYGAKKELRRTLDMIMEVMGT